jgi:arsenate reductase
MDKPVVLFLCTGNSARSQMAEALLKKHAGDHFDVYSAGTEPKLVHPLTVEVLKEVGIDWSQARSKPFQQYLGRLPVRYVIIVCSEADRTCPTIWPGVYQRLFWPFDDPARAEGSIEERRAKFRAVRDQIEERIVTWTRELTPAST